MVVFFIISLVVNAVLIFVFNLVTIPVIWMTIICTIAGTKLGLMFKEATDTNYTFYEGGRGDIFFHRYGPIIIGFIVGGCIGFFGTLLLTGS